MKKTIKKVIAIIIVVFVTSLNLVSIFADTVQNKSEIAAKNLVDGKIVLAVNTPKQVRYLKANYIKALKEANKSVHSIVIGSSHMLSVSSDFVGNDSFANLAVGSGTLQDKLDLLGLLYEYDIKYNHVIFEMDLTSFSHDAFKTVKDYSMLNPFGENFIKLLKGENTGKLALDFNANYDDERFPDFYFSSTYNFIDLNDYECYYRSDASMIQPKYSILYDDENKENMLNLLKEGDSIFRIEHISARSEEIMDSLMEFFKRNNVKVTLVIVPRPPKEYDGENMKDFPLVNEVLAYAIRLKNKYNCKISGSFDPHLLNISDEDYLDGFHMKPEALNRIIDFEE